MDFSLAEFRWEWCIDIRKCDFIWEQILLLVPKMIRLAVISTKRGIQLSKYLRLTEMSGSTVD